MDNFKNILENLKERYLGTNWNWLVNKGKSKAGDITKVTDVQFKNGMYFLIFNNGAKINVDVIKDFIVPTKKEPTVVDSKSNKGKIEVPDHLKPDSADKKQEDESISSVVDQSDFNKESTPGNSSASDIFDMFDTVERDLNIKIKMKLPEIKLLKLMFKNSTDSVEFLNKLSSYVLSYIKEDNIQEALLKLLVGSVPVVKSDKKPTTKTTTTANKKTRSSSTTKKTTEDAKKE